jgi:hypothetical protein
MAISKAAAQRALSEFHAMGFSSMTVEQVLVALAVAGAALRPNGGLRLFPKDPSTPVRLSPNWRPNDADARFAIRVMGRERADAECDAFRDYWTAKPGRDACKLDWDATWRNWVRRAGGLTGRVATG